jgi:hypothetical protein
MTGLNLEAFLGLLRADLGAWLSFAVIILILAVMTWTSWGSHKALRKCLVLSIVAHIGLVLYGGTIPLFRHAGDLGLDRSDEPDRSERIKRIDLVVETDRSGSPGIESPKGRSRGRVADWDQPGAPPAPLDRSTRAPKTSLDEPTPEPKRSPVAIASIAPSAAAPELASIPNSIAIADRPAETASPPPADVAPGRDDEIVAQPIKNSNIKEQVIAPTPDVRLRSPRTIESRPANPDRTSVDASRAIAPAAAAVDPVLSAIKNGVKLADPQPRENRERDRSIAAAAEEFGSSKPAAGEGGSTSVATRVEPESNGFLPDPPRAKPLKGVDPKPALAEVDVRGRSRRSPTAEIPALALNDRPAYQNMSKTEITRATPRGTGRLPDVKGAIGGRPLDDVPEVYRSRLDPDRSALARKAGASDASEQAVERALDWLARHQDADGRWNAGTVKNAEGVSTPEQFDFTVHCPPGETCAGACFYAQADTATTGLSLLAYLGAGYTHIDGKYTDAVYKGLQFLLGEQKRDGDLRGDARSVGMYCHAMATLALCEAYALTGDEKLRDPVERGVRFLVHARSSGGSGWRYIPNGRDADTSVLGWVVMVLKSAREVRIPIADEARSAALDWLDQVKRGTDGGLAVYMPGHAVTPTMTAEAWVCRLFLGVDRSDAASDEAATYLSRRGGDRDGLNYYYLYYGTLAMFQRGGVDWTRWNRAVRDRLIDRQVKRGHSAGSWNRDDDKTWGALGGRVYWTAMATLTLEVYYRYLRLNEPIAPRRVAPAPRAIDPALRRSSRDDDPADP